MGGAENALANRAKVKKYLSKLEKSAKINKIKFKNRYKISINALHMNRMKETQLHNHSFKRSQWVLQANNFHIYCPPHLFIKIILYSWAAVTEVQNSDDIWNITPISECNFLRGTLQSSHSTTFNK